MDQEIQLNTKEVTLSDGKKVKVRKPKLRDIREHFAEDNVEERQVLIVSTLTQMTVNELDDLPYSDFLNLAKEADSFL